MTFTLTTSSAIIRKAGANASSLATTSYALLLDICTLGEGVVCAESRHNWLSNLPSTSFGLALLSDAVACWCGNEVAKYNLTSYFSRAEAQTLLDVNIDNFNRDITLLRDSDVRVKMGVT